ncbi:MAG: DUF1801 domain-containing protein [Flavobacteriaceae bacterium]|nr:DUF1801 domain-containing protein [Flavobacteriaceae bacterium]
MKPAELYILNKPEPFKTILMHLQILVESTIAEVELKYKWKIPVYYIGKKPLCYFNASIKKGFVDVAFWTSTDLSKFEKHLVTENRKVVKSLRYFSLDDIDEEVLIEILQEINKATQKGFYSK